MSSACDSARLTITSYEKLARLLRCLARTIRIRWRLALVTATSYLALPLLHQGYYIPLQLSTNLQATNRKSNESIENADYKTTQYVAGFRWEFISNFELLGGFISQTNKGFDFIADRNGYTEVIYYTLTNYSLTQQIKAVGIRYNFSSKAYLCALYQQSSYQDKLKNNTDFNINQFGLLYNISL